MDIGEQTATVFSIENQRKWSLRVRNCSHTSFPYIFRTELPMARTVRNPKMDTRSARLKLAERREP
jgi:hypothetical protein